jgi:hypothetical protein
VAGRSGTRRAIARSRRPTSAVSTASSEGRSTSFLCQTDAVSFVDGRGDDGSVREGFERHGDGG